MHLFYENERRLFSDLIELSALLRGQLELIGNDWIAKCVSVEDLGIDLV